MNKKSSMKINTLPLIVTKDLLIFEDIITTFLLGRDFSIKALDDLKQSNKNILVGMQKSSDLETVSVDNIYGYGSLVEILQVINMPDDTVKVMVKALNRVELSNITKIGEFFECNYRIIKDTKEYSEVSLLEVKNNLIDSFTNYLNNTKKHSTSLINSIKKVETLNQLVNVIATHITLQADDKVKILKSTDILERVGYLNSMLEIELDIINVEKRIRDRVKQQMEKNQKDYYLSEQIKAIQKELNNGVEVKDEQKEFQDTLKKLPIPKDSKEKIEGEIKKLSSMNPISAEASVVRNYVETVLSLPWGSKNNVKIDLQKAEEYLQEDHYGLGKVKERILEYIAVLKKSNSLKAPILCLVGPPGVGKTSLAKSLAKAADREFVRISLGGVRDEAEIRGHRRTYIGAMPGKIINAIKKVKTSNPLILLDEIDKMGSDFRGDPASALLEVLDPEQNNTFVDHYIEIPYDLSNVMFITTANSLNIQDALLDRMEIIQLSGYTEDEKLEIAKRHLLPKKMKETNLSNKEFEINDEAILSIIRHYTKESGVRGLEQSLAAVARKVAKDIVQKGTKGIKVNKKIVENYLGSYKFIDTVAEHKPMIGVTTGLAWTPVGGDILYIEALKLPGKGNLVLTGKLGEVMQESVKAAFSVLKSNAEKLGIDTKQFSDSDFHVHVPEGATPKDGPSAGIAIITSLYSILTDKKVRNDVAMTGEITLRGKVLPIGGLREKMLAALRYGIRDIIIPEINEKDLVDLPKKALQQFHITKVNDFNDVLLHAILNQKTTAKSRISRNKELNS